MPSSQRDSQRTVKLDQLFTYRRLSHATQKL